MQLYLVQNDPLDTLLVSADGEPLYSIHTSASPSSSADTSPLSPSSGHSASSSTGFPCVSDVTSVSSASSHPSSPSSFKPVRPPLTRQFAGFPQNVPSLSPQKHRQPPANTDPTSPISRTHSNPHPYDHSQYPDPSSPQPSPALPPAFLSGHVHRPSLISPSAGPSSSPSPVTLIKRLERYNFSRGNVETEIGRIDYRDDDTESGTRVLLCNTGTELYAPAAPKPKRQTRTPSPPPPSSSSTAAAPESQSLSRRNDSGTALDAFRDFCLESQRRKANTLLPSPAPAPPVDEFRDNDQEEFIPDPTWTLKDPADRPFKWLSLASCPVLIHDTQPTPTPVARYRPAKLGIVSRSRRGFLEILPAGLDMEDWIVVTFVAYFRMKLGEDACRSRGRLCDRDYHGHVVQQASSVSSMVPDRSAQSVSVPGTPSMLRPRHYSPHGLPPPPPPLAYLGALRRKGKNYDTPRPNW